MTKFIKLKMTRKKVLWINYPVQITHYYTVLRHWIGEIVNHCTQILTLAISLHKVWKKTLLVRIAKPWTAYFRVCEGGGKMNSIFFGSLDSSSKSGKLWIFPSWGVRWIFGHFLSLSFSSTSVTRCWNLKRLENAPAPARPRALKERSGEKQNKKKSWKLIELKLQSSHTLIGA